MSLLFNLRPLVVNPELAVRVGLNEAIIVQQIHYWLNDTSSGIEHDGARWVYNTLDGWHKQFPFWSQKTIKRTIAQLARLEVIRVEQLAKSKHDRTNYYAINYGSPYLTGAAIPQKDEQEDPDDGGQGDTPIDENGADRWGQNDPIHGAKSGGNDGDKMTPSIGTKRAALTETTTETTAEITADISPALPADAGSPAAEGEFIPRDEEPEDPPTADDKPRVEIPSDMPGPKDRDCKTFKAWANYSFAYRKRYEVWPAWNAQAGGMLGKLIDRIGADLAPKVAAFFISINDARLIRECHPLSLLLQGCEGYRTQYLTGRQMNGTTARQLEATQANANAAEEAARQIREGGKRNAFL